MAVQDLRSQMPNVERYESWRRPDPIEGILIHHSEGGETSVRAVADRHLGEGRAHVGYHYAIGADGTIFYLLDEAIAGYHAALPRPATQGSQADQRWQGQWLNGQYFNRRYLGVLLLGRFNDAPPPAAQWQALLTLLRELQARHSLPVERVEGHREALARAGFGSTGCPGSQLNLPALRAALSGAGSSEPAPGPVVISGPAPALTLPRNRPLLGLHARNDYLFTSVDWQIIRTARVESLKMMSFTKDEVYTQARAINPQMEFIVRLYSGHQGRGQMPGPGAFAALFYETIERLYRQFGVVKFEIHNEPNHLSGLEGWGQSQADAEAFQRWYLEVLALLRQRHPQLLFGYPGLAVPHNDLQWLEWNREAIEASDWLGCHIYWQTPPGNEMTYLTDFWGLRFKYYHQKYPHKLIEITEFGNSNGQSPPLSLSREAQREQYQRWFQKVMEFPYIGSVHGFIASSPDPTWSQQGFTWGNEQGPFPVATALGTVGRPARRPEWHFAFSARLPEQLPPSVPLTFPVTLGNGGRLPWEAMGSQRLFVVAKWVTESGQVLEEPATSAILPHPMAPGEQTSFTLTIQSPASAGRYQLRLALFHNGFARWLHQLEPATAPDFFPVEVAAGASRLPELAASYHGHELPGQGIAAMTLPIRVTVRNEGTRLWRPGEIYLGYQWLDAQGQRQDGTGRVTLSGSVASGEQATLTLPVRLPDSAGPYTLQLGLVTAQGQPVDQALRHPITVEAMGAAYSVSYHAALPTTMTLGERREVVVRLHNRGSQPWLAAGRPPTMLVHQWLNAQGEGVQPTLRTLLPHDVAPGAQAALRLALLAPGEVGRYTLRLDLSREGEFFFSQYGNPPLNQTVQVEAAAGVPRWGATWLSIELPGTLPAGGQGRLDVQLRNTGQRLWPMRTVRLAYRWSDDPLTRRVPLPTDVPPGGEVALGATLVAPTRPGVHTLTIDLWEEGSGWLNVAAPLRQVIVQGGGRGSESHTLHKPLPVEPAAPGPSEESAEPGQQQASASHQPEQAPRALDGHKLSAWRSGTAQRPGMWFQVDLGTTQPIQRLRVLSARPEEYPRAYLVEGSLDGAQWQPLAEERHNWSDLTLTLPQPTTLRYLRLSLLGASPWHEWSIRELDIE